MPKSVTFAAPSSSTRTFCGLTSRWTIWLACAAPSARAISIAYAIASDTGSRPLRRMRSLSVSPSTYSKTMYGRRKPSSSDVLLAGVDDADDVRVVELRDRARLAAEALELVGVPGDLAVHELDRDLALEHRVERPVDRRHPAGPDLRVEAIALGEQGADG